MNVQIQIPEVLALRLQAQWGDLSQRSLEAVAVEAYREGVFTVAEVRRLLGHTSRWQTEAFLHERQAFLHYSEEDLAEDTETIREVTGQ